MIDNGRLRNSSWNFITILSSYMYMCVCVCVCIYEKYLLQKEDYVLAVIILC